jgi:L-ribulokinase
LKGLKNMLFVGIDFGTESGRALLVNAETGTEIASAICPYVNRVIDERLPHLNKLLPPDWALQDPQDYLEVLKQAVPAVLRTAGIGPEEVAGVAIAFTSSTILPTTQDGTPLCFLEESCLGQTVETSRCTAASRADHRAGKAAQRRLA